MKTTHTKAGTLLLALCVLVGCSTVESTKRNTPPKPSESSPTQSTETARPKTASKTALEALDRLSAGTWEDQEIACSYFTSDAYIWSEGDFVSGSRTQPMLKWCGENIVQWSTTWEDDRGWIVQEEVRSETERWVRISDSPTDGLRQRIMALSGEEGNWLINRWCFYTASDEQTDKPGGDNPFYCLEQTR